MPDNLTIVGIACSFYALAFAWFTIGTARVSQQVEEGFFRWPPAGRVIVAFACFGFFLLFASVAHIIFRPAWLEPVWPADSDAWDFAAAALFPLPFCIWVAIRLVGGGLTGNTDRLIAHEAIPRTYRDAAWSGLSDNVRRSVRCVVQVLIAGLVHELLESNGVYMVDGWWEAFVVAAYAGTSNLIFNTLEDRWGVRFLPPLDHQLGDAAIGRQARHHRAQGDSAATVFPRRRAEDWGE